MSTNTSESETFVMDENFKVDINRKMKVPDKICFNTDVNEEKLDSWIEDNLSMNVPERILVVGQHQHVGTRAPPREIVFDNSLLSGEPYPVDMPRVSTPPRTLTLDKYSFPGIEHYEQQEVEDNFPFKHKAKPNLNDSNISNSLRDCAAAVGGVDGGLTPAEEVLHLRRQLAKLNRRIMALEFENINRLQKEKFILGFGIAYFFLKVVMWMNRN